MTGLEAASVACALAAAVLFAIAGVTQQQTAAAVPEGGNLVTRLLRNPRWWGGAVSDTAGYGLQIAALALGSVLLVQPLLVSSLLFALPLAAYFGGYRLTRGTWMLAAALCVSLAIFLLVGNPAAGTVDAAATRWAVPLGAVLAVTAVAVALGSTPRLAAGVRAALLGAAGGLLYGVVAAFTKHVTDLFEDGLGAVLTSWQVWVLAAAGIGGYYIQQRAFQVGPLSASLPALTIGEPLGAVFLGMVVLGERLQVSGAGLILVGAAVLVMLTTTVALSRVEAPTTETVTTPATAPPPENPRRR